MSVPKKALTDKAARVAALTSHQQSLLVEAGAGAGKTAIMAGRIAIMLTEGVAPRSIAAVTFTELAASELVMRVREFVDALMAGDIPIELRVALPDKLSQAQQNHLATAAAAIDDLTCSTIHGFCQRLIKPYPVEADIDPGADVIDRDQADLVFVEIVESWLRERLSADVGGLIAEMVLQDPIGTVSLIHMIVGNLRRNRMIIAPPATPLPPFVHDFQERVTEFVEFIEGLDDAETETVEIVARFGDMSEAVKFALTADDPASIMRLIATPPHPDLCTKAGAFSAYRKKGKWGMVAKRVGLAKADGDRLNDVAEGYYKACTEAWTAMFENAASRVLVDAVAEVQPVLQRYRDYKRSAAMLDFDDLIFAARDLLRTRDDVRRALAARYTHVLVDEFQDTDPLQVEIFWRLCGDPPDSASGENWMEYRIRPGALFLVGDPKQAIYRFRGADVGTYVRARDAFFANKDDSVVSISTNFRSYAPILTYVNKHFEDPLSSQGQPGFTALAPFHTDPVHPLCVAVLDVAVAGDDGKASIEQRRDGEADAVAEMCARLIGSATILDHKTRDKRLCRAGDIALLAPTGNDLWRYEEALERFGVPVATQAGKGLFRRQEIQDLIALTRVLADRRDTLALGALLRGPLVGLTEEELLDVVWALPRSENAPENLPRFDLSVDPDTVQHLLARDILEKLQGLRRRANSTTPHDILSQAVDVLRVRPILMRRHRGQTERALANVDLYLNLARAYSVRGLRAFAEAMTAAWADESRAVEGRPDAQEEAVALYTMHAAKGLEWPIVVPVNTMTRIMTQETAVIDRENAHLYCPVFGIRPIGYKDARDAEKAELDRERIRLWYVAVTRPQDMLVLPRLDVDPAGSSWLALLNFSLADLPPIDLTHLPTEPRVAETPTVNLQTREVFQQEAAAIANRQHCLVWLTPSRDEDTEAPLIRTTKPDIVVSEGNTEPIEGGLSITVQGGRERGKIIHKLFEEVLNGETADDSDSLTKRATILIDALGKPVAKDPREGLSPSEIASCIAQTLALPEIAELRPTLVPEFPVYASEVVDDVEQATTGITDATSLGSDGAPQAIIDWKSDVDPQPEAVNHYRSQIKSYLRTTGLTKGLLVFVTHGVVLEVS
ncbi:MAG: UvrD-helicase domain-containing protein [Candidatus Poribacteria bacterium]|nr:UvrD-helicase domain-containing protein [Candidatus Poribacteria bacterium]